MSEQQTQHENWLAARGRIASAALAAKGHTPTPTYKAPPSPSVPARGDIVHEAVETIMAAVSAELKVPMEQILSGPPESAVVSARQLAMALCVRRAHLTLQEVVESFDVTDETVRSALALLDPILCQYAITGRTPLSSCLPLIVTAWLGNAEDAARNPTIREIQSAVAIVWRTSVTELTSARRSMGSVEPRHVAIALCRKLTKRSGPEIGRMFGGRDHTTVLHAVRKLALVTDGVESKMHPLASPLEWARAMQAELLVTPLVSAPRKPRRHLATI